MLNLKYYWALRKNAHKRKISHLTFFLAEILGSLLETLEFSIIVFPKIPTNVASVDENGVIYFIRKYRDLFWEVWMNIKIGKVN